MAMQSEYHSTFKKEKKKESCFPAPTLEKTSSSRAVNHHYKKVELLFPSFTLLALEFENLPNSFGYNSVYQIGLPIEHKQFCKMHLAAKSRDFKNMSWKKKKICLELQHQTSDSLPGALSSCLISDGWKRHNFGKGLTISRKLLSLVNIQKLYRKVKTVAN